MRILLVEDEISLQNQLEQRLKQEGYVVDVANDGEEGLYFGTDYPIDIAIIDLGLPKLSGIDLINKLRIDKKSFPILILTANSRWQDKVEGLSVGADDYLVKPFQMEELLARLNALIRRANGWSQSTLISGPISLNSVTKIVTVNGSTLELTAYEFKVLEFIRFCQNASKADLSCSIFALVDLRYIFCLS